MPSNKNVLGRDLFDSVDAGDSRGAGDCVFFRGIAVIILIVCTHCDSRFILFFLLIGCALLFKIIELPQVRT
jgi:hypothetical protein